MYVFYIYQKYKDFVFFTKIYRFLFYYKHEVYYLPLDTIKLEPYFNWKFK